MKGHRLPLAMLLAAMSYALSVIGGSTILPLPPIFWSVAPPITEAYSAAGKIHLH